MNIFIKSVKFNFSVFKKILFALLFLLITLSTPLFVFAQNTTTTPIDLTVSPPVFDLNAKPGDKITESFRVRNNQSSSIDLQVSARRLISDPNSGSPVPESQATGEELSWVSFKPGEFSAKPREWTTVNFTIDIPQDAAFGYYYVFSISPKSQEKQKNTGTSITGELLVVVLLNVNKEGSISKADLISFKTENMLTQYLPVKFQVNLENPGNVHVKPRGNIFISRNGKDEIAILDVNNVNGSILPGGKRTFEAEWNDGFITNQQVVDENGNPKLDKNGNPVEELKINWNKLTSFRIGPYNAQLLLIYDDGQKDQVIESQLKFWVIPYIPIIVLVAGIVIIILGLRLILKAYINKELKKREKNR